MKIGEFFVSLGIKGAKKSIDEVSKFKDLLGVTKDTSLETKAALAGAAYAFERLFVSSAAAGTNLTNFNALTGVSTRTLQQYQYAAKQMGVSNDEVAASFQGIQSAMTKALMGEGAPRGLGRLALLTGALTPQDLLAFQNHPELLLQKLQQYSQLEKNAGIRNEVLKSFGLSSAMASALTRNAFTPQALRTAPAYGDKEINSLNRANIAWTDLGIKIEMAIGHFNARHGRQLVSDISALTTQTLKLADAFERLSEKLKFFKLIDRVFTGWALIFNSISDKVDSVTSKGLVETAEQNLKNQSDFMKGLRIDLENALRPLNPAMASPGATANTTVNQTLNFQHDGRDHKRTADSTKKAIQDYYRQNTTTGTSS